MIVTIELLYKCFIFIEFLEIVQNIVLDDFHHFELIIQLCIPHFN